MKEFQSVYEIRENLFLLFGSVRSFDQKTKKWKLRKGQINRPGKNLNFQAITKKRAFISDEFKNLTIVLLMNF